MFGSIFKYVTKTDESQSSSNKTDSHVDARNYSDNISLSSGSNSDNTELMMIVHEGEESEKNTGNDSDNTDNAFTIKESICIDESLQGLRDVAHWCVPVPDNVRIDIIKKGNKHFQNTQPTG